MKTGTRALAVFWEFPVKDGANIRQSLKCGKFATSFFLYSSIHCLVKHVRHSDAIKSFGIRLRQLRKQKGLTLEELAGRADLEYSQVSRIERGIINTSLSQIMVIAEALEIHPSELFHFEAINTPEP